MFHHSISTQSSMALSIQFRAISHLTTDDHWNGCLLNRLRGSYSRNNSICFTIDVAIHRLGFLCRPHQHGIPVEFDEMNETFNINESSFSFDSSMQTEKINKGPNQMISIRTGLGVMFSPSVVVFCWDLNNTVQSTTHTFCKKICCRSDGMLLQTCPLGLKTVQSAYSPSPYLHLEPFSAKSGFELAAAKYHTDEHKEKRATSDS